MIERILVPMDGSEQAQAALRFAIENHPRADVTVLHAYGLSGSDVVAGFGNVLSADARRSLRDNAEGIFDRAHTLASEAGHEGELTTVVEEGDPKRVIPDHAEAFDAVFIGTYGRKGTYQVLLGSVAETIARRSPVPVMLVK